ncbi:NAD-dependent epimerase/dehydratase family protein [bacterium]|nr:NAD-dependent epimerase/dehydratase family protein [bacterium]
MKILVTGGAGFIGSNVADAFINAGHEVAILDDLSSGTQENVNPKAKFYQMDIADPRIDGIFAEFKPQVVNHHAAQISVPLSVDKPREDAQINIMGWLNLLEAGQKHQVEKIIYVSSGGVVYGEPENLPAREDFPMQPASPYGISKYAGEMYLEFFARRTKMKYVTFRYSNVYGPRQVPHGEAGVVSIFIKALLEGIPPTINGDGSCVRDYVFVGDVVEANLKALTKGENIALNIGTNRPTDVNVLYETIKTVMQSDILAKHGPSRRGDLQANYLDAGLAGQVLGWEPRASLSEGIARTVEFFKNRQAEPGRTQGDKG